MNNQRFRQHDLQRKNDKNMGMFSPEGRCDNTFEIHKMQLQRKSKNESSFYPLDR